MNKKTKALTTEQYKEIITTMREGVCGCRPNERIATALVLEGNLGLRISDILRLTFADILEGEMLIINEKKTGKHREIPLSIDYKKHIADCFKALGLSDTTKPMFLSYQGSVITIQMVNKTLHELKSQYNLSIEHFTSHSLRKTFARRIYDTAKDREYALIKLSSVLGHSNISITRRYLGI